MDLVVFFLLLKKWRTTNYYYSCIYLYEMKCLLNLNMKNELPKQNTFCHWFVCLFVCNFRNDFPLNFEFENLKCNHFEEFQRIRKFSHFISPDEIMPCRTEEFRLFFLVRIADYYFFPITQTIDWLRETA